MSRYGIAGSYSGDLLTYQGAVIVHGDKAEMEWLLPGSRIVRVTDGDLGAPVLQLRDHPDCRHIVFPLRREDFR